MSPAAAEATERLRGTLRANHDGAAVGVPSVCSAEPFVLQAALERARRVNGIALVESTCNQVNQDGGYTGVTPAGFAAQMRKLAAEAGLPPDGLALGGDHLGPYPWRTEPAEAAMAKARALVRACVAAGYTKIHLDPSMPLGGDPTALDETVVLARTVELCRAAEAARAELPGSVPEPLYVIGTEVPAPGGERAGREGPAPTRPDAVRGLLARAEEAFRVTGLDGAWRRVVAVVAQPGVEFGVWDVHRYDPVSARGLAAALDGTPGLVYEAHSTDYQSGDALRDLVRDHFAVLKVGPALTFAYREALFALEEVEREMLIAGTPAAESGAPDARGVEPSHLRATLDTAMVADPRDWRDYYVGDAAALANARAFSLSDRCRYYWPRPEVRGARDRLLRNLAARPLTPAMLERHLPAQARAVRAGEIEASPEAVVRHAIGAVLGRYWSACGA
jgi:D-tagatose-1,6-bisphosphate aldolase subunit GatZ/KbaZ